METIKTWLKANTSLALVGASAVFFLIGVGFLALCLVAQGQADGDQVTGLKKELQQELTDEQAKLDGSYTTLLSEMGGLDAERVDRDEASGHTIALSLAHTSGSTLDLGAQQQMFLARYSFLTKDSTVITGFLPEWLNATTSGGPVTYDLTSEKTQVTDVSGLTYSYMSVVRLDPVGADEKKSSAPVEYLLLRYDTDGEGSVISLDVSRASSATRDAFVKADEAQNADDSESTDDPTSEPTTTATSGN